MNMRWKLNSEYHHSVGVTVITIAVGTELESRDNGKTFRFVGLQALTVLLPGEVLSLAESGKIVKVG